MKMAEKLIFKTAVTEDFPVSYCSKIKRKPKLIPEDPVFGTPDKSWKQSTGTKSSENDRFCPIFVFSTGTNTSEKNGKKVEKKVFLMIYPGLKGEFLRPKTFLKNFIYVFKTPVKYFRKKFVSTIYPGSSGMCTKTLFIFS
jgi:hypothetical protein